MGAWLKFKMELVEYNIKLWKLINMLNIEQLMYVILVKID